MIHVSFIASASKIRVKCKISRNISCTLYLKVGLISVKKLELKLLHESLKMILYSKKENLMCEKQTNFSTGRKLSFT